MAKKKKNKKKDKKDASQVTPLETILTECALAVGRGVGAGVSISAAASDYWLATFKVTISKALANGGDWSQDRKKVLGLAVKMGQLSVIFGTGTTVDLAAAEQAAKLVRKDQTCPGGAGGGRWCV